MTGRSGARRALVLLSAVVLIAGCASDDSKVGESGAPPGPKVGECRNTPASNLDEDDWVDDTPVVDCSKPHTLQTLKVVDTDGELTAEKVQELAKYCEAESVGLYVDFPGPGAYNIVYPVVYGPTPEQTEAGESWVRCDAGIKAETHCCRPLATQSESLEGAMGENPARFQECIADVPEPERSQPLTSCEEPHRAELLLPLMELDVAEYPSKAELRKAGQSVCSELVADRDDAGSLVLTPVWQPENEWQGRTLYGSCWIHRNAGMLPAVE